jgi:DNA polymerase-1
VAERKKLAIIDGKSVFYRGYYALPNLSTKDGIPTGGVYGFAAMALELLKKLQPDYVAVAWDKPKTNIRKRKALYPEYKAGRKAPPPDFYAQIPILHELLQAFDWPLYELDDYEADDIMGTLAVQAAKKDIETMLITSDLDILQVINHHAHVYALKRGFSNIELFHPESFEEKYNLKVEQFLDYKSIAGDSSDNVPGVPGIGPKGAVELLQEFKTLDGVYKNLDKVPDKMRAKLEAGKDSAYLSKKLLQIWTDAPIKLNLSEVDGTKIDTFKLRELLQQLEFKSLLNILPPGMQTVGQTAHSGSLKLKVPKAVLISSDKELDSVKLKGSGPFFTHSRAAGKHGEDPQVLAIGDAREVNILDLTSLNPDKLRSAFAPQFSKGKFVGYDVKSDLKVLKNLGLPYGQVAHDVLVAGYLISSLTRNQSLTDLAAEALGYDGPAFEDLPTEDFVERLPETIAIISELHAKQTKELAKLPKVAKLAQEVEWPLTPILADMELEGIKLDSAKLKKISSELEGQISDIEQTIYGHADSEFNISSPAQLADILFVKLNLPTASIKKTKSGYSTAASELFKLRELHPIIDLIGQYREMTKLKSTYLDTLPQMVDKNSRLHTTFSLTIAPTGRLSSADPNLQNIPVRTELGKRIREAFVAEKGNTLVSADYSNFELRLAAVLANEKSMIEAFNKDEDIHVLTAAAVHGIEPKEVTKQQRYEAKAVNYGLLYGQGPHGLAEGTGMSFGQARSFIERYFLVRPKLKDYIEKTRKLALEQGYVETMLGRRRPTPDVKSSNFAVREAAYRAAINMPAQGTAADIMKLAMIKVAQKLDDDCKMLLQIHDSLLLECPTGKAEKVGKIVKEAMENAYKLPVMLKVDVSSGKNWGEL